MDRLTHNNITNCIKELDALGSLVASGEFTYEELADWIAEISWNLSNTFQRRKYNSDEFRLRLRKLLHSRKTKKDPKPDGDSDV